MTLRQLLTMVTVSSVCSAVLFRFTAWLVVFLDATLVLFILSPSSIVPCRASITWVEWVFVLGAFTLLNFCYSRR